jgi:lysine 2,3-aminomutase
MVGSATGGHDLDPRREAPATAHDLAARDEAPFVNLRDPARALGPDGRPAVSRRAAIWADVPDERWNDWRWQLSNRVNSLEEVGRVLNLTEEERAGLSSPDKFRVDITPYFLSLMDPDDPNDPIRRQVIPTDCEHEAFTSMMEDSLAEDRHSPVPGLVHRYPDRVLMLVTTQCASYCRYCTRSRIVGDPTQNFNRHDIEAQLDYLRRTPQVRDVLLSGGDALTLAPKLLESILRSLREIPHIEIVRIGSRVPVFLPQRIDDELCDMLAKYHPLWMNLHFNHPNEITPEVSRACDKLTRAGIPIGNQSVLLAGVNDCLTSRRLSSTSSSRTASGPTTSTSATWSRARDTSGRRSAKASRSWRACAATPRATRSRRT